MREAIAIILGVAIGIVTNLVSEYVTPFAEKRKRFVLSVFAALIALSLALVLIPTSQSSDVFVVNWEGLKSYGSDDELLVLQHTCKDSEHISSYSGKKPKYWVSFETYFEFTFVNRGDQPDGIVRLEHWYPSEYDKDNDLRLWYLKAKNPTNPNADAYPIELSPGIPAKRKFDALTVVETRPDLYEQTQAYGESLSPLHIQFALTDGRIFSKQISLIIHDGEGAANKTKFVNECADVIPGWPTIPIAGRGVPK